MTSRSCDRRHDCQPIAPLPHNPSGRRLIFGYGGSDGQDSASGRRSAWAVFRKVCPTYPHPSTWRGTTARSSSAATFAPESPSRARDWGIPKFTTSRSRRGDQSPPTSMQSPIPDRHARAMEESRVRRCWRASMCWSRSPCRWTRADAADLVAYGEGIERPSGVRAACHTVTHVPGECGGTSTRATSVGQCRHVACMAGLARIGTHSSTSQAADLCTILALTMSQRLPA